jgi:hypothetical protein
MPGRILHAGQDFACRAGFCMPGRILLFGPGGYDGRIAVTGENDVQ